MTTSPPVKAYEDDETQPAEPAMTEEEWLCVGGEHPDDIIADLNQALASRAVVEVR